MWSDGEQGTLSTKFASIDTAHVEILASLANTCFDFIYLSGTGSGLVISAVVVKMIRYGQDFRTSTIC